MRLQKKVIDSVSRMSISEMPDVVRQQRSFAVAVAGNFNMNSGTLRGKNSIHVLNCIIIQASENVELKSDVNECLNDLCELIVSGIDANFGLPSKLTGKFLNTSNTSITTNRNEPNISHKDESYHDILVAYGLMNDKDSTIRETNDKTREISLSLLSSSFATYLSNIYRPLSKIMFLPSINQNPSSLATSKLCLKLAKVSSINSQFQKRVVIVVPEKIQRNCVRASSLIGLMTLQIYC